MSLHHCLCWIPFISCSTTITSKTTNAQNPSLTPLSHQPPSPPWPPHCCCCVVIVSVYPSMWTIERTGNQVIHL